MLELIGRVMAQTSIIQVPAGESLTVFWGRILNWILYIAGALAVIYLIYGGILYITAGGDAEKATAGKTAVVNAIIGIIIIALALVIVAWVNSAALNTTR